jgi:hypothetical protein
MRAVANSPEFAKKVGVPQGVGKDFEMADKKMKKFNNGAAIKLTDAEKKMGDALMMTKRGRDVMDAQKRMEAEKEKADAAKRAKADKLLGIPSKKKGGTMKMGMKKMADKMGRAMTKKSADTAGRAMVKKYAKGGSIDGCATKGKTKGKMVTMNKGGYC